MFKGKTKIELFDGITGKKTDEYKDQNMVTNAIKNMLGSIGSHSLISGVDCAQWMNYQTPLYPTYLRGILLWDSEIQEEPDNIFAPPGVKCVGHAGSAYSGTRVTRGTLNANETAVLPNGVKIVWDFATDKANGTIKSISLTSQMGGNCGWFMGSYDSVEYFFWSLAALNVGSTKQVRVLPAPKTSGYTYSGYIGELKKGSFYFINPTSSKGKLDVMEMTFANPAAITILNKAGDLASTAKETVFSIPTDSDFTASNANFIINGNNYVFTYKNGTAIKVWSFDLVNKTSSLVKTLTLSETVSGTNLAYFNGHIYVNSSTRGGICKFDGSGQFVAKVSAGQHTGRFHLFNGCLIVANDSTSGGTTPIAYTDGTDCMESTVGNNTPHVFLPSKTYKPPLFVSYDANTNPRFLGYVTPYMATINNLAAQVVKTSEHTMKVTYELIQE